MSTLSVPLTKEHESFIEDMIRRGVAPNKAEVVRQALARYAEDQAVESVLQAEREAKEGKLLSGDLNDLLKKMP